MHVRFLARGRGSDRAAADYLLGERDAAGRLRAGVEVVRGDPDRQALTRVGNNLNQAVRGLHELRSLLQQTRDANLRAVGTRVLDNMRRLEQSVREVRDVVAEKVARR